MLDKLDRELIKELQKDGRQSYVELAKKLHVAETTVRRRLQRLLEEGFIRVVAVPDPFRLGFRFVCTMRLEAKKDVLRQIGRELAQSPNIYYLSFTTGEYDIIAIFLFRSAQELADFMWREVSTRPDIVRTETAVNMEIVKTPWSGPLNVDALLESGEEKE